MSLLTLALVCLLLPFGGFLVQYFVGRRLPGQGAWLTVFTIGVSLACAIGIGAAVLGGADEARDSIEWFAPGGDDAPAWTLGILVDGLTATMLFVVTLVSFVVHLFSVGYLKGDAKYPLFFAWLQMFSVAMLLLVLADNLLLLFVGWELVGLCSYKLIGFWSEKKAPANAARKAFITTRIGDLGMIVALMAIAAQGIAFDFESLRAAVPADGPASGWLILAAFGLLAAAAGKSAQVPFHVWLPDAMEGPTPVSALIHAATMVAAGVYLLGRTMFMLPVEVLYVVGAMGAVTALMAGFIALAQNDIKRVLAYSTVSQLGYMFLALGVGAWHAGLFHLTTHAFFKALLFLGSGSVIHACHHEQDMRKMGGLWKKLPVTGTTFLVGVLAIAGIPIFSGFYSKDAILSSAYDRFPVLFWIGLFAAVLTAFYMARLFIGTFLGKPKDADVHAHAHESPWVMTVPLVILALLATVAGVLVWHETLLDPTPYAELSVAGNHTVFDLHGEHHAAGTVLPLALGAGIGGLVLGWIVFSVWSVARLERVKRPFGGLERVFANKFYFDELYREVLLRPTYALAKGCAVFDAKGVDGVVDTVGRAGLQAAGLSKRHDDAVVDGTVRGVGEVAYAGGGEVSRLQNGRVRFYLSVSVGLVAVIVVLLLGKAL